MVVDPLLFRQLFTIKVRKRLICLELTHVIAHIVRLPQG